MSSLLRWLSTVFVVAGVGGCLLIQDKGRTFMDAAASPFLPAIVDFLGEGQTEVRPLSASKEAAFEANARGPVAEIDQEELETESATAPEFVVARRRLMLAIPDEIERYFDLFMYVSKSTRGPLAQQMFVFRRDRRGRIVPHAEWQVSTGREKMEWLGDREVSTATPEGVFALDPGRFHREYWSKSWDDAPMHFAMFYDLKIDGYRTGLAIHAAIGEEKVYRLGRRDSGGCIRLAPRHAEALFYKIRNTTRGRVPVFAVTERGSTNLQGRVQRNKAGKVVFRDGYRALLFVENYDGEDDVFGSVSDQTKDSQGESVGTRIASVAE